MNHHDETFVTWNNIASLYQDQFMHLDLYNESYDFICQFIEKDHAQVLDMGCGPGNISKYLLSKRPDFDLLGIDMAPNMIALAKQNNPTANFLQMDCRMIHRINKKFDAIIGGFCIPYLSPQETQELILNASALLNNLGLIYLSFVEGDPNRSEFKVSSGGRVYFHYHRLETIQSYLNACSLKEVKCFQVKYPTADSKFDIHTIVLATKENL